MRNKKASTLRKRKQEEEENPNSSPNGGGVSKKDENKIKRKTQILSAVESLNVDIPTNRELFRSHYASIFSTIMRLKANPLIDEAAAGDDTGRHNRSKGETQQRGYEEEGEFNEYEEHSEDGEAGFPNNNNNGFEEGFSSL